MNEQSVTEWASLWMAFGPFVVAAAVKWLVKPLKWWSKISPFSQRLVIVALSGAWAGIYSAVAAFQSGADLKASASVFCAAVAAMVLAELKKGYVETKDLKSGKVLP